MEKRYNFRIYPNAEQEIQIQKNFGCVRFIYNYYLAKRKEAYENGQGIIGYNEMCRDMTQLKKLPEYEWLKDADHNSLQRAIKQLDLAYKAFFRNVKRKGTAPGYPAFKTKKASRQSYTSSASMPRTYISKKTGEVKTQESSIMLYNKHIKLPKLGRVKCRVSKVVCGRILSATVIQVPSGKYYVSVVFTELQTQPFPKTEKCAGIHMGIQNLITTSDGLLVENPRYFQQSAKKIARLQKELSRKTRGSRNFEKTRSKLAKAYEHVSNQKTDFLQKLTTRLVREYDIICVRKEPLTKLKQKRRLSKQLANAGWGELLRLFSYKCDWYGKKLILIEPFQPSARMCSRCGYENMVVSKQPMLREWECPNCHSHHQRGINAAINILQEGIQSVKAV